MRCVCVAKRLLNIFIYKLNYHVYRGGVLEHTHFIIVHTFKRQYFKVRHKFNSILSIQMLSNVFNKLTIEQSICIMNTWPYLTRLT